MHIPVSGVAAVAPINISEYHIDIQRLVGMKAGPKASIPILVQSLQLENPGDMPPAPVFKNNSGRSSRTRPA
jgi:hypothetical protein